MKIIQYTFEVTTKKQFTDITDFIEHSIDIMKCGQDDSAEKHNLLNIFVQHTSCGVKIMENEVLSFADIQNHLSKIVPKSDEYLHDRIELRQVPPDERRNAISHIRMLYFPTSITIPVSDGKLQLGEWQRIILVELDYAKPFRERKIILSLIT